MDRDRRQTLREICAAARMDDGEMDCHWLEEALDELDEKDREIASLRAQLQTADDIIAKIKPERDRLRAVVDGCRGLVGEGEGE